jgi:hypothetical protein
MDTWLIVVLAVAAVIVIGLLILGRRKGEAKRQRRGHARRERIEAEKHRARAEVAEESARERAERDQLEAELHERRAREIDPDTR